MARKLRIAASVLFGVLTLLLVVMWVRSDRQVETLGSLYGYRIEVEQGRLNFVERVQPPVGPLSLPVTAAATRFVASMASRSVIWASIPLWIPVVIGSLLAALPSTPWLTWRFSLRTLLAVTTLVAIVMGLGVWLAS